jgi:mannose-6-phosphate isomerase-like protein (cupin superfamily)
MGTTSDTLQVGSDQFRILVDAESTGGRMLLGEVTLRPGGEGPPLHRHPECELYIGIEGRYTLYREDETGEIEPYTGGPGQVSLVPSQAVHTIRNEGAEPARAFVIFSPGTSIEAFMRGADALGKAGPPDLAAVLRLATEHGMTMLDPVPRG